VLLRIRDAIRQSHKEGEGRASSKDRIETQDPGSGKSRLGHAPCFCESSEMKKGWARFGCYRKDQKDYEYFAFATHPLKENAGSWLNGKPEFYGAEARDWVEGFVVAFEESDGAARGDCGGMARCREPGFPHFL